jgi:hypothetical protein
MRGRLDVDRAWDELLYGIPVDSCEPRVLLHSCDASAAAARRENTGIREGNMITLVDRRTL